MQHYSKKSGLSIINIMPELEKSNIFMSNMTNIKKFEQCDARDNSKNNPR